MWGETDLPQYNACLGVSFLVCLNIMTIPAAIDAFFGGHLVPDSQSAKVGLIFVFALVLILSYFVLVHDRRYKQIAKEFAHESHSQRRKRLVLVLLYISGTFLAFFGFLSLGGR